jgi:Glycosyl transferases group 1
MTARAALELIASPLGSDRRVQIIVAGIGSERYETSTNVLSLGPITNIGEFYDRIHATVVPVTNGTGMKGKLGEAALAGKAVITTSLGADGYPPNLRDAFVVVDDTECLNHQVVTHAIKRLSPESIREQFDSVIGYAAAVQTYAGVLGRVTTELSNRRETGCRK